NLLGLGIAALLTELIWRPGKSDPFGTFENVNLFDIPVLGFILEKLQISKYLPDSVNAYIPDPIVALNNQSPLVYLGILLIPICHILLFHTTIGLRIRVIGEHPQAAATAGVPVQRYQYFAVIFSGILSSLGGAILAFDVGTFDTNMVGGKGFLALAAMIFGKWTVLGSVFSSMFFGYFFVLSIKLPIASVTNFDTPPQFLQMIPNVVAILALAGFIGRAIPPKAIGKPYDPAET
ncbi:MAG: ABC transporter permease, partial [Candidatus Kariarchaeaceae archaeon]